MPAPPAHDYATATLRNRGYVPDELQQRIRGTRLLIAGCGIGSAPAVCAARLGFERFILVDGDRIEAHNLNRQFYDFADVGRPKAQALRDQILRINPAADVLAVEAYLDAGNTDELVAQSDVVFDTVDFLDLQAILRLHESAARQQRPILTALSVGFGALVWAFPVGAHPTLPELLAPDIAQAMGSGASEGAVYASVFERFITRLAPYLDDEVLEQVGHVLREMKDGRPCPASQLAVGSFAIGAMSVSMMRDLLAGRLDASKPQLVVHSFARHRSQLVEL